MLQRTFISNEFSYPLNYPIFLCFQLKPPDLPLAALALFGVVNKQHSAFKVIKIANFLLPRLEIKRISIKLPLPTSHSLGLL